MSSDAKAVVACLFDTIWQLFTAWHIPGTDITPAAAFAFFICAGIGLKFMGRLFGVGINIEEGYAAAHSAKSGINRRIAHRNLSKPLSTDNVIHQSGHVGHRKRIGA